MSAEPLFCTRCGAEDWACGHGPHNADGSPNPHADDGKGPFCECAHTHEWVEGRCIECGAPVLPYLGVEEDEIPW